jgi:hypothetical protein
VTDPDTWWLNLTNIALGVGVLLCFLAVAAGAIYGAMKRRPESHISQFSR